MRPGSPAAASPLTWGLALILLLGIDAAITRTPVLWARTWFENPIREPFFLGQSYRTARAIYAAKPGAGTTVALVGNSRLITSMREENLQHEVDRLVPDREARVSCLGVFGMGPVITELLTRHLGRMNPDLVVLTINGSDLRMPVERQMRNPAYRLLGIGWRDGPVETRRWSRRIDRWLRTAWRLWRFREFSRAAIRERLFPPADPPRTPEHFDTIEEVLRFARGPEHAPAIEAAYRRWKQGPTLARFVSYLKVGHAAHLQDILRRTKARPDPLDREENLRALDAILDRFSREPWKSLVLLMPENPLLELDIEGRYHRPGVSDREAELLRQAASRHGITVVDGRHWMPAEAFMDFDHLWPDISGFEKPLAREIARELRDSS